MQIVFYRALNRELPAKHPDITHDATCFRDFNPGSQPNKIAQNCALDLKILAEKIEILAARGLTVPQVALAYLVNQPPLEVYPIVGARTPDEVAQNAAAFAVRLTPEEVAWLDLRREDSPL